MTDDARYDAWLAYVRTLRADALNRYLDRAVHPMLARRNGPRQWTRSSRLLTALAGAPYFFTIRISADLGHPDGWQRVVISDGDGNEGEGHDDDSVIVAAGRARLAMYAPPDDWEVP